MFLKYFFEKVIETPELQHEDKNLSQDDGETCTEILDLIHSDFGYKILGSVCETQSL